MRRIELCYSSGLVQSRVDKDFSEGRRFTVKF